MFGNTYPLTVRELDKTKKWEKGDRLEVHLGTAKCEVIEVVRNKKGKVVKLVVSIPTSILDIQSYKSIEKRIFDKATK